MAEVKNKGLTMQPLGIHYPGLFSGNPRGMIRLARHHMVTLLSTGSQRTVPQLVIPSLSPSVIPNNTQHIIPNSPTVIPNGVRNLMSAAEDGMFLDDPECGKNFRFFVVRSSE